jgi:hypothetical protein
MRRLQYVILHHEGIPEPHFDLMFETLPGSELATWRSPVWPMESPVELTRLKDHRRTYLDYEGDLSNHRGRVHRVAQGKCEIEIAENAVWTFRFLTGSPHGTITIRQIENERWEGSART